MSSITREHQRVWFITGANRGIGFELVTQILSSPSNTILAGCRNPSNAAALHALAETANGRLHVVQIDVTSLESIHAAALRSSELIGERGIDYLINNAGVGKTDLAFSLDMETMAQVFRTNTLGPTFVSQRFLPLVERSTKKTIINISSSLGSVGADLGTKYSSYAIAKAGLNMLTYKQSKVRPDIITVSICPGWLDTDMGGTEAEYPVSVGVSGILEVVRALKPEDTGRFFNFKGETVPW